jgi:hypothetical protein
VIVCLIFPAQLDPLSTHDPGGRAGRVEPEDCGALTREDLDTTLQSCRRLAFLFLPCAKSRSRCVLAASVLSCMESSNHECRSGNEDP